jgi:hypothetical protein
LEFHKHNRKNNLKITKIMIIGANLKFNKLIILVLKRGSESKRIR